MLTQKYLKSVLLYEPATGEFIRRVSTAYTTAIGEVAGCVDSSTGYIKISVLGRQYYAHRLVWLYVFGRWPTHSIDHKNLNRADNAFSNLREATKTENSRNTRRRADNTSGAKGVYWSSIRRRWVAEGRVNGVKRHLGCFKVFTNACRAYEQFAKAEFGEFANTGATACRGRRMG
jgi:hypothetical protein